MPIYKWRGEYWYGYEWTSGQGGNKNDKRRYIRLWTRLKEKGERYNFEVSAGTEKDPIGMVLYRYRKTIRFDEQEDPELPKNYLGDYYWVWYNGAFFKVLGETEKYVLVDIEECGYEQADALGIPREEVACDYHKEQNVGKWWLKKKEIKMPDEEGKGKYIYLYVGEFFILRVFEIVRRDGSIIRVRGKKCPSGRPEYVYEWIKENIKEGTYPWSATRGMIKEIVDMAEGEVWIEGDCVYYEATFDLETLKKYKGKRDKYGRVILDYYLYGEEQVPYRL